MNAIDFGERTQLWLDRLACGELDEHTRKHLFAWLDAEPLRWRCCALALLEAQTWNESLEYLAEKAPAINKHEPVVLRDKSPTPSAFRWASLTSLAAVLLVTFTLGALSRGWLAHPEGASVEHRQPPVENHGAESEPAGRLMATVSLKPELSPGMPATLQIPVMSVKDSLAQPASAPISDYDRQKWERRGYQLTTERRFLPAKLPSGKKVVVPVEQVKANYVGSKVS